MRVRTLANVRNVQVKVVGLFTVVCLAVLCEPASAALQLWSEGNGTGPNVVPNYDYPYDLPNGAGNIGDLGDGSTGPYLGVNGKSLTPAAAGALGATLETYTVYGSLNNCCGDPDDDGDLFNFTVLPGAVFTFTAFEGPPLPNNFGTPGLEFPRLTNGFDGTGAIVLTNDVAPWDNAPLFTVAGLPGGEYSFRLFQNSFGVWETTITITQAPPAPAPEPTSLALAALGLVGLVATGRRRRIRVS